MAELSSKAGTLGHLTTDEEQKLQEAWVHIFRLCGLGPESKPEGDGEGDGEGEPEAESKGEAKGDGDGEGENPADAFARIPDKSHIFRQHINQEAQDKFLQCLWSSVFVENPDATVLRFLRARKWDVEKAMIMLVSAVSWRYERRIEETIMRKGESVALAETMTEDEKGFINQYRSGKSFVRGVDKEGRPIYIIRVRLHDPSLQSSQSMENYVLHSIESMRALVSGPQDKACLVFDMTGMGLKNMDYHVVKFLVTVFEARYPETLGVILIHNAPFIFGGIWRIIKGWLDPVIAAKINFTRNNTDMQVFIPKDNLQSCYGGLDDWEFEYVEPVPGENDRLEATEDRERIEAERNALLREYERLTIQWVSAAPESASETEARDGRKKLAEQLRANYWALDPYVRATNYYKRVGVVDEKGNVDFKGAGREELST